jgi:hypothetical protein
VLDLFDGKALLAGTVISTIAGMAGVGKTALAIHLAHRLAPHFPDGQLYIRLHGHSLDIVPVIPPTRWSGCCGPVSAASRPRFWPPTANPVPRSSGCSACSPGTRHPTWTC